MLDTRRTLWRVLAALFALSLIASACGGDDDDTSNGGDDNSDDSAVEETLGEPNPASGEPVKLGLITEGGSEAIGATAALTETGAEIAVEYANEYLGGIAGRPIDLFVCGTQSTPAGAQDCANQMVEQGVVAVTMPFNGMGEATAPIITDAGIPYVTGSGNGPAELTVDGAFALTGGYPGSLGAFAKHASEQGFEKLTMIVIDVPSATQAAETLGGMVFAKAGVDYEVITAPPGSPDLTPQLQAAVDGGADAVALTGDVTFCTSFLQAYQTLALDIPKYLIGPCIDSTVLEAYGNVIEGSYLATNTNADGEDAALYGAMVTEFGDDIDPDPIRSTGVAVGVGAVINVIRALDGIEGEITKDTVMAQIKAATDVPLFLSDPQTFTCDGTAVPIMPSVCSAGFLIGTLTADAEVTDAVPVDATDLFEM